MRHLILGTAGHVDHGKTALVKALTGVDCDTHAQEKQRGITINLGFTHLALPSGDVLGIVDVPGHRDFVRTMVGGASGIDLALLVVAADCGVMPQTREHLQIMDVLGIRGGLVALTRIDLAEPELVEMAAEEVGEFLAGSFLEGCPVVPVSAVTGEGLEPLKAALAAEAARHESRSPRGVFRMFVDRNFTVSGFGTVVAGSVITGRLRLGDEAYLLPGSKKPLRVRRLERYGEETEEVVAGDRAALNLAGLAREDVPPGSVVADRPLRDTERLDARLALFPETRKFGIWTQVEFHLGTSKQQARVHLLDRDELSGGGDGLVQVHLGSPCVVRHGDRFILRSTSGDMTLGGGQVIDPAPLHHRRRPDGLIEGLAQLAEGDLPELIAAELAKHPGALEDRQLAEILNTLPEEVAEASPQCRREAVVCYEMDGHTWLIDRGVDRRLKDRAMEIIADFHRQNPLLETGRTTEELVGLLGLTGDAAPPTARLVLEALQAAGQVKAVGHTWAAAGHAVRPDADLQAKIDFVAGHIEQLGIDAPRITDLQERAGRERIDEQTLGQILRYLVERGRVCSADGVYIHASLAAACRQKLLAALAGKEQGVTVAEFRDLVAGNRKTCLALLALFDEEGITKRRGDVRVLTAKGREASGA